MQPVLRAFHDQVLFLKHNLNADAISSLQSTAAGIDTDVKQLIAEMEASINDPSCKKIFDDNYVIAWLDVLEKKGKENLENPGSWMY